MHTHEQTEQVVQAVAPVERLSPTARIERYQGILNALCSRDVISYGDVGRRMNNFHSLVRGATESISAPRIGHTMLSPEGYLRVKRTCRKIGEMLRNPRAADAGEFRDLASWINSTVGNGFVGGMLDRWNAQCRGVDELTVTNCGHLEREDAVHDTYDDTVCDDCFNDLNYVYVEDSEDYRQEDEVCEWSDGTYRTYEEDDDGDDDDDDDDDDDSAGGNVMGYSTNVLQYCRSDSTIESSVYGEFLTGVELEVAPVQSRTEAARHTANAFAGYAILKNDGSLEDNDGYADGFEIVTAPRTITEHVKRFSDWAPHEELRAWDPGCCGMHVHISSHAFSQVTLGKFIEFINAKENDELVYEIAGRHPSRNSQAGEYCRREGSMVMGNPKGNLRGKSSSRYHMVNSTNLDYYEAARLGLSENHAQRGINTIELRIFRATLSKPRLLAQLEFTHAAVMFCRSTSMRELRRTHFIAWLHDNAGLYPNLAKWFGVKANKREVLVHIPVRDLAEV